MAPGGMEEQDIGGGKEGLNARGIAVLVKR